MIKKNAFKVITFGLMIFGLIHSVTAQTGAVTFSGTDCVPTHNTNEIAIDQSYTYNGNDNGSTTNYGGLAEVHHHWFNVSTHFGIISDDEGNYNLIDLSDETIFYTAKGSAFGNPPCNTWVEANGNWCGAVPTISGDCETIVIASPEIDLKYLTIPLVNGSTLPVGPVYSGSTPYDIDLVIENTGNAVLNLTGVPAVQVSGSSNITVKTQPSTTISAGESTTFTLTVDSKCTPSNILSNISILNDDADESNYTLSATGIVNATIIPFSSSDYCPGDIDPTAIITGITGGTFSSSTGLSISANGTIDLSANTPGDYIVGYSTVTCPGLASSAITIKETKPVVLDQSFSLNNETVTCGSTVEATIASSETNVNYFLTNNTKGTLLSGGINGTGNALNITSNNLSESTSLGVVALSSDSSKKSMAFAGNGDKISVAAHNDLDFTEGTIEFSFNPATNDNVNYILASMRTGLGLDTRWSLHVNLSTNLFGLYNGTDYYMLAAPSAMNMGTWYHVAFVFDATKVGVYLDGVYAGDLSATMNSAKTGTNLTFGGTDDVAYSYEDFKGTIDQVSVWNVKRSPEEIVSDMKTPLIGGIDGLVLSFPIQEDECTAVVLDASRNDHNATLVNNATWTEDGILFPTSYLALSTETNVTINDIVTPTITANDICAGTEATVELSATMNRARYFLRNNSDNSLIDTLYGKGTEDAFVLNNLTGSNTYNVISNYSSSAVDVALNFDGVDDYIDCSNDPALQLSELTLEAWFRTNDAGTYFRGLVVKQGAYGIFIVDNILYTYDFNTGGHSSNITVNDGKWHHVALSYSGTQMSLYLDGVFLYTANASVNNQNSPLQIGYSAIAGQNYKGDISDVVVYNEVKSASEIASHYNKGVNPSDNSIVVYYDLNENTGTTVMDASSNDLNGTFVNMDASNWIVKNTMFSCVSDVSNTATVDVTTIDKQISVNENDIVANSAEGTFQWLDCTNENAIIDTETSNTYTATMSGSYAVEITVDACVNTSLCQAMDITVTGGNDKVLSSNTIYPNPVDQPYLQFSTVLSNVSIWDVTGEVVLRLAKGTSIEVSGLSKGVYLLKSDEGSATFIKE